MRPKRLISGSTCLGQAKNIEKTNENDRKSIKIIEIQCAETIDFLNHLRLADFWRQDKFCDVVVQAGGTGDTSFKAHRLVLAAGSDRQRRSPEQQRYWPRSLCHILALRL